MALLTRSLLGLLERRRSNLSSGFIEAAAAFDADEWDANGALSVESGELRLAHLSGSGVTQHARFTAGVERTKAFLQMTGRNITTGGAWGPAVQVTDITIAAESMVRSVIPHGFSGNMELQEIVAGSSANLDTAGPRNYTNNTDVTQQLAVDGGDLGAYVATNAATLEATRDELPEGAEGRVGWSVSSGSNNNFALTDFIYCRDRYVTIYHDVPDGYVARVHGALDSVVASAEFVDGVARVDMLGIVLNGTHERVSIVDGDSTIVHSSEQMYIWPGDVFGDPPPTFGEYFESDAFNIQNLPDEPQETFPGPRKLYVGANGAMLRYGVGAADRAESYVPLALTPPLAASPVGAESTYHRVHLPVTNVAFQDVLVEFIIDGDVKQSVTLELPEREAPTRQVFSFDLYDEVTIGAQTVRSALVGTWFQMRVSVPELRYRGLIFETPRLEASAAHEFFQEAMQFSAESIALLQAASTRRFYIGGEGAIYRMNEGVLDDEDSFVPLAVSNAVAPFGEGELAVAEKLWVSVLRVNESPVDVVFTLNVDGVDQYTELRELAGVTPGTIVMEVLEFTLAGDYAIGAEETVRAFAMGTEFVLRVSLPDGLPDGIMIFEERKMLVVPTPNTRQGV